MDDLVERIVANLHFDYFDDKMTKKAVTRYFLKAIDMSGLKVIEKHVYENIVRERDEYEKELKQPVKCPELHPPNLPERQHKVLEEMVKNARIHSMSETSAYELLRATSEFTLLLYQAIQKKEE